jgi:hypothetical protein
MIIVEDELGGIPLLLIFSGTGWLGRILYQKHKQTVS